MILLRSCLAGIFTVSTPKRKMDHSPGELEGEIDHLSRDAAVEYLLMPERVKKLEGKVDALHYDLEELTSLLKRALQPPVSNNVKREVDYVA